MTDVNPNRWGEPPSPRGRTFAPSGRGGGQISIAAQYVEEHVVTVEYAEDYTFRGVEGG